MDQLFTKVQQRLTQKYLDKASLGAFLVQKSKKYAKKPELLTGKVVHSSFTLYLSDEEDQAHWFMHRIQLLSELNQSLKQNNYDIYIQKIRFMRKETILDNQEF